MKKVALGVAGVLALILIIPVVEHVRGRWGLARWRTRMESKGEPLTFGAATASSAGENGMLAVMVAANQIGVFPAELLPPAGVYAAPGKMVLATKLSEWPYAGKVASNVTWEILGEAIKRTEPALRATLGALTSTSFHANVTYKGWATPLPHIARSRQLERALNGAAMHRLHARDLDEGVEFTSAAIRLVGALRDEPFTISHVVRFIIAGEAYDATWQAAHADGIDDAHLRQLQAAWAEQDFLRPFRRALSVEHVVVSDEYDRLRKSDLKSVHEWMGFSSAAPRRVARSHMDAVLNAIEELGQEAQKHLFRIWKVGWSYQDQLRYVETVERGLAAWDSAVAQQSSIPVQPLGNADYRGLGESSGPLERTTFRYMLSPRAGRFFPAMKKAFIAQTLRELAITGLALRRYEMRYGKTADSLGALVPEFLPTLRRDFMDG